MTLETPLQNRTRRPEVLGAERRGSKDRLTSSSKTLTARLSADEGLARSIADHLSEHLDPAGTAVGVFEGPASCWTVEASFRDAVNRQTIRDLVTAAAAASAARGLTFEPLSDRDWVRSSLAGLRPVEAGRFVVHGTHDRHCVGPNRIGIEIEAALAFGTGHHGTTRGCLIALDEILKASRPRHVLDLGTGTGVLAIAAAKALHAPVLASDIDPVAVRTARANAKSNAAGDRIEIVCAAGVAARRFVDRAPFELVFANILLEPLQRLARPLSGLLAPNARVIVSGLLPRQANAALAA